jgi:hypothetical protein
MNSKFKHIDLKLIKPDFGSNLTKLILDLDYLRKRKIEGTTCPVLFYQLKKIFHLMESIGSLSHTSSVEKRFLPLTVG